MVVPVVREFGSGSDPEALQLLFSTLVRQGLSAPVADEEFRALVSRDALVVFEDDRCIAWAAVQLADGATEADLMLMVDADASQVARTVLLQSAQARACELGAETLLCYLAPEDDGNLAFLESAGASHVPGYSRWTVGVAGLNLVELSERLAISVTDEADLLLAATHAAWGDLPGHKPATLSGVAAATEAFGSGSHCIVLGDNGQPVGLVRSVLISADEGYVDAPGLAPEWRSAVNYAALAGIAMNRLAELGATRGTMDSWGDPSTATEGWFLAGWELQAHKCGRRITAAAF